MSRGAVVGIDLGTTNTCVAHVQNKVARVVPSDQGRLVLPSVVSLTPKGELVVGKVAKERMITNPESTVYGHKRLIGRSFRSPVVDKLRSRFTYEIVEGQDGQAAVRLGGEVKSLVDMSAVILAHVKTVSEQFLGGPVTDAVITVPAYYNDLQRTAVKESAVQAGFHVRRIVNEPTAAALAYGFNRGFDQQILVYDLGGGTFDVSILRLHGNVFEVVATGGDTFLGGGDFDDRVVQYVLDAVHKEHKVDLSEELVAVQRVKAAAEAAKIDLSLVSNVVIELPYITQRKGKPIDLRVPLSRERLNQLTGDLVERTFRICDEVLEARSVDPRTIAEVILVGGQSRMPLVQDRIQQHFGKPPRKGVHPDEVVALGAALLGDALGRVEDAITLVDVLSVPVGIATPGGAFKRVIDRNVTIPHTKTFGLPPPPSEGGAVELDVFQGESDRIAENEYLGTVTFPRDVTQVTFKVDAECMLHVVVDRGGERQTVKLATRDVPESLRAVWEEKLERERLVRESAGEERAADDEGGGLFASIRKVFKPRE